MSDERETVARDIEHMTDDIKDDSWNGMADGTYTLADLKRFQRRLVSLIQDMDEVYRQRLAANRE